MKRTTHSTLPALNAALMALTACALLAPPAQAQAQTRGLGTQAGEEVGVSLSRYTYDEPGYMDLKATKLGVDYAITRTYAGAWPNTGEASFLTGELRFATGQASYTNSSGTRAGGLDDWYWEARALYGVDLEMDGYVLSPYAGLGYRYLFNDLRSLTNGYRRESRYISLPLGITVRTRAAQRSQLLSTVEYVHLLSGKQDALLSDIGPGRQDAKLNQRSGSGLRLKVIRQFPTWSIGPTLTYWRVGSSDVGGTPAVFEPKNNTVELGLSIRRRF